MKISMKTQPPAYHPSVGDMLSRGSTLARVVSVETDRFTIRDVNNAAIEDTLSGLYNGWQPVRAPQVGDVWRSTAGVSIYLAKRIEGGFLASANGQALEPMATDSLVTHCKLVVTGALSLADREELGTVPDIDDDNSTPLERAHAEIERLRADRDAWKATAEQVVDQRDAEGVSSDGWREGCAKLAEELDALRDELVDAMDAEGKLADRLAFARAFAASQGRVIAGLKAAAKPKTCDVPRREIRYR